jgi:cytochrome P450
VVVLTSRYKFGRRLEIPVTSIALLQDDAVTDPYRPLRELREHHPIWWDPALKAWLITRYDDVRSGLRDERLSADRITSYYKDHGHAEERRQFAPTYEIFKRWMVFNDPPIHTRMRSLVNKAFTPRVVANLKPRIKGIVNELIDGLAGQSDFDLIRSFSYPLPAIVIAEMLGVPTEDRDKFKAWSDDLMLLLFAALEVPDRHERGQVALQELTGYFADLAALREKEPRDDLITQLVHVEESGDTLTRDETAAIGSMLLFAGHETTTNLIANGMLALMQHPAQLARLRAEPDLIGAAVEEMLRYDGPVKSVIRNVAEPYELHGQVMNSNERAFLFLSSANRDPRRFVDPDVFDITRKDSSGHLAFASGMHFCLGAPLARLEAAIGISALIDRFPTMSLADDELSWHSTLGNRSLTQLRVEL